MKKILAIICLTVSLFGSNGKISGLVSQKINGDPGIGVNIVLVDSYLGAATDENGRFTILNVPPGTIISNVETEEISLEISGSEFIYSGIEYLSLLNLSDL